MTDDSVCHSGVPMILCGTITNIYSSSKGYGKKCNLFTKSIFIVSALR